MDHLVLSEEILMLKVGLERCTALPILGNSTRAEVRVGLGPTVRLTHRRILYGLIIQRQAFGDSLEQIALSSSKNGFKRQ